ncbi:MAG TPA: lysophospholipid acyltransferase family protein [Thermoanaerobaculia bacterium]|nr:lysophospholipid acyltransferase family protein [Thermoanaerobaculia bacterium]
MSLFRRFGVKGVFWRQFLRWAVFNIPLWLEPLMIGTWSAIFLLWGPGRRGVMRNLTAIKPGSWTITNFFRTFAVFWNFAWTIDDNVRFKETRTVPDWEFAGLEHFEALQQHHGGAIILTAHMGNYDLGAHLFAETSHRKIVMIRAPEVDPDTRAHEEELHRRTVGETVRVDFSGGAGDFALDLLHTLQRGEIVAIQGDRVTPGIAAMETKLFGRKTQLPAGPFALAMAARVPIFPLFIVRVGRRHYRLVTRAPIEVVRTRDRAETLNRALEQWTRELESVIRDTWYQWFAFEPYSEELAA